MTKYFGTDGVRGIANKELSPELAFKLGRCGGYVLTQHSENENGHPRVLVARDTRISGQMLQESLISGLLSVGIEVLNLDVITTPAVAYLVRAVSADAGIMISASHNPAEDNGIKFFGSDGYKLPDDVEDEIEELLDAKEDTLPRPSAEGLGSVSDYPEGAQKYLQFLKQTLSDDLSDMNVVLDTANGSTSRLASTLFADLDVDFDIMASHPDGININKGVGSTHPEALAKKVKESDSAVAGLAFDGDGDRCIAVDEEGNIVDGDKIMFILGKYLHDGGRLKKDTIVTTVMSNLGLYKAIEANDMKYVQTAVGDRHVVEEIRENGYNIGGEQSGHVVLYEYMNTGDGMLTGIHLLHVMKETGKSLSELAAPVKVYPQKLVNIPVKDKNSWKQHQPILDIIKTVEDEMDGDGRVLVRPSGTQALLRVMCEASTEEKVNNYCDQIVEVVKNELN
ncbi:phosphoglucosamine mutase [Companilactobacillus tucceti DSM 20183]|uniref:Phosphoglucosamine mutase n=1 Tax=Companilactobacillus tucceti DSM 20183 TaxID=1423811 RepID=A0A0R1J7Z9_9LACO|nr:phosphoglucosamine mutase [Companilactobacillus tucceti]KRK63778.1 phosphoglucosamine mutase [Companilactobacillus tucceti DSM 20183]